jgi:hypothetical protein
LIPLAFVPKYQTSSKSRKLKIPTKKQEKLVLEIFAEKQFPRIFENGVCRIAQDYGC